MLWIRIYLYLEWFTNDAGFDIINSVLWKNINTFEFDEAMVRCFGRGFDSRRLHHLFLCGRHGFDGADESSWRIGNVEAVRTESSRSKKQTTIPANDEVYAQAA